jgi:hypothetical protein
MSAWSTKLTTVEWVRYCYRHRQYRTHYKTRHRQFCSMIIDKSLLWVLVVSTIIRWRCAEAPDTCLCEGIVTVYVRRKKTLKLSTTCSLSVVGMKTSNMCQSYFNNITIQNWHNMNRIGALWMTLKTWLNRIQISIFTRKMKKTLWNRCKD